MNDSKHAVFRLALSSLRFRAAASLATFVAILLGSSLLIACGGLFESAIRLEATPQRLAGTPIAIIGTPTFKTEGRQSDQDPVTERAGIPAALVAKAAGVEGVASAVPDVSFAAVLLKNGAPQNTGDTVLSGHGWASAALTPYALKAGTAPSAGGQVVLDAASAQSAGAKAGDRIDIAVDGAKENFLVSGVAAPATSVSSPAIFFSSADTQRFAEHGNTADIIGVLPAAGADIGQVSQRLTDALGPAVVVLTGDDVGSAEFVAIDSGQMPLILLASIFGAMLVIVMTLIASTTISLTVRQRQQELALLRATGATPRQVQRMVVAETMVVAAIATFFGLFLGRITGKLIFSLSVDRGVVPSALVFNQGIIPFAGGALVALVTPYVAATIAGRAAARTRPIQALAEAAIPPVRVGAIRRVLAKAFAVVTAGMAISTMFLPLELASSVGGPAVLTGSIAVALIAPELIEFVVIRLAPTIRRFGGAGSDLAIINTRARAVAFAAVLTPITLATAVALGNIYQQTTMNAAASDSYVEQFSTDLVVTSSAGGIDPGLLAQVRQTPGVANASEALTSNGWLEQPNTTEEERTDSERLLGLDAQDKDSVLATPVTSGSLRDLTGDTVAAPESEAEDLGVKIGDPITVRFGDGARVVLRLVATTDGSSAYPTVVLPARLLASHTTGGLPTQILVRAASGKSTADLATDIGKRTENWPGVSVGGREVLTAEVSSGINVETWINYLLAVLAIAYAAIAAVNTLSVAVLSRRRELGVQRLAGATRRQVRRMLFIEGGIIAVVSLVLGTVISLFTIWPTAIAVGFILPAGPVWIFVAVVVLVFLIVWPAVGLSSRLAMKRKPIEVIGQPGQ